MTGAVVRVVIVDDEPPARRKIRRFLDKDADVLVVGEAGNGERAIRAIRELEPDLVFLDIQMPKVDGFGVLESLKKGSVPEIVFVTAHDEYALKAFEVAALDYLLKPFDRRTLAMTLEGILQRRRLRAEHDRLLAENIEYIGERTVYHRALGIFSTLAVEPLAMRIVEALCLETRAQGGVMWVQSEGSDDQLDLAAARGLVRLADEPETVEADELPRNPDGKRVIRLPWGEGDPEPPAALYATLEREGQVVAIVRVTDKLEGEQFDALDEAAMERFVQFADVALANALRVRWLEQRSLRDPATGTYNLEYFHDVVRNEIEKATRFGRTLALIGLDLGPPEVLQELGGGEPPAAWLADVAGILRGLLRATDVLAGDGVSRFYALLPEADALGASVLKRRLLRALEESDLFREIRGAARPRAHVGISICPSDAMHLEPLLGALDTAIDQERGNQAESLGLDKMSLPDGMRALVRQGSSEPAESAEQLVRFVLTEVGRRAQERGVLYAAPGKVLGGAVREGLEALRSSPTGTDLVVVSDGEAPASSRPAVSWVPAERAPGLLPCLVHYGDGPVYALIREEGHQGSPGRLFHTSDRGLVEHLAFRLQEELGSA